MRTLVRIGTRGSPLALWQAHWVRRALLDHYPDLEVELQRIRTTGDRIRDVPLARIGGKGLFVKELEEALLREDVDLAVHSMKDVPVQFPEGLGIVAVTAREDPRDALVSRNGQGLSALPKGARVGTSSLRRMVQLRHLRPDLQIIPLRGNLDTRLRKLETEGLDAIVVAVAGLRRMGWEERVTEYLDPPQFLPAIGQGVLGLEARLDDEATRRLVAPLNDPQTQILITAERAFLERLEGGCQVPLAAHATLQGDRLCLEGLVSDMDGKRMIRDRVTGPPDEAPRLGQELAERLLNLGGAAILQAIYGRET